MEIDPLHVIVGDASAVGEVRRGAMIVARKAGLSQEDVAKVALVVTEAASNLVKHAGGGEVVVNALQNDSAIGVDVVALDHGPGIANFAHAARDGFSTSGSPGTGLGAMARLASEFDVYAQPGRGTAVFARISAAPVPATRLAVGALAVPIPGETVSGDGWQLHRTAGRAVVIVVDGLGHGPAAHQAASAATTSFSAAPDGAPLDILERIHAALRPTRGAAVAVADIDPGRQMVRFAGIGNIAGTILQDGATRSTVSHHGTAGHQARRIQEFSYPWAKKAALVLHSDGLRTAWSLKDYPGLSEKHPVLIAAMLYRDFRRGRDDTTVVVVRDLQ
jgi:anti-sigma regulatory factor (Ser/Thr protein kinase)